MKLLQLSRAQFAERKGEQQNGKISTGTLKVPKLNSLDLTVVDEYPRMDEIPRITTYQWFEEWKTTADQLEKTPLYFELRSMRNSVRQLVSMLSQVNQGGIIPLFNC